MAVEADGDTTVQYVIGIHSDISPETDQVITVPIDTRLYFGQLYTKDGSQGTVSNPDWTVSLQGVMDPRPYHPDAYDNPFTSLGMGLTATALGICMVVAAYSASDKLHSIKFQNLRDFVQAKLHLS